MKKIRIQQKIKPSGCFFRKPHVFLLVLIAFLLLHSVTYGTESKQEKRVLILFPDQSDLPAYPLVEKGIKLSLAAGSEFHIEYFIEYMDLYRHSDKDANRVLLDLYRHKFSEKKIDLIIAYSAPALNLVMAHRNDLFPQVPVVFSGILREQLNRLTLEPMVTGVLADIDYAGLLDTALKIQPQTRHIAIVNGASETDLLFEKEFRKELGPYAKQLDLIYLTRLPFAKIVERVRALPNNTVILFYSMTRDGEGKGFPPWEAASILAETANAPVYGCPPAASFGSKPIPSGSSIAGISLRPFFFFWSKAD